MIEQNAKKAWGDEETRFFYELTPDKILNAVESFGFRCTGRCNALNSMENRVYEVEIDHDDPKSLKSASDAFRIIKFYRPGRWSREQILEEHQFLHDLTDIEIPVVAPLALTDGETLLQVPDSNIWCTVFPKVGGRNPDELSDEQIVIVGRLLARMHNAGAVRKPQHRISITPTTYGRDNLEFLLENRTMPEAIESRYADAAKQICDISSPWFEQVEYQRIHGDCHLGNLLWGAQGPFWVDFDDMLNGPCVQDLWLILPGRDEYAEQQLAKLLDAYEVMRDFDRRSLRLIEPLRALRMIHFNAWIAKRWEDPAFQRTFVEFGSDRYWGEQLSQLEQQLRIIQATAQA